MTKNGWTVLRGRLVSLGGLVSLITSGLLRQQIGTRFEVVRGKQGPALALTMPLAEPQTALRVLLEGEQAHYYLLRNGEPLLAEPGANRVDRGVYLLLAELASGPE